MNYQKLILIFLTIFNLELYASCNDEQYYEQGTTNCIDKSNANTNSVFLPTLSKEQRVKQGSQIEIDFKIYNSLKFLLPTSPTNSRLTQGSSRCSFKDEQFTDVPTNNSITNPDYLAFYKDPKFNAIVTRITDRINQNDDPTEDSSGNRRSRGNAHPYPKTQAWNSDMSIIRLGYRLYDANSFKELNITSGTDSLSELYNINGALSERKWSNTQADVFYGHWNNQFWKGIINKKSGTIKYEHVHTFNDDEYDTFTLGKYEGNIDYNDEFIVFAARKKDEKYLTAIVYNIKTDTNTTKDIESASWPDSGQVFDWISVSPLGNHILLSSGGEIEQYDMNLNHVRHLSDDAGHGDIGVDVDGVETYLQYEYGDQSGIWSYRLSDGLRRQLLPNKYNGGHISCRNYNRRGWCYLSTTAEDHKEILALRLDNASGTVNRLAQTHTNNTTNEHNSLGNVSPDGRRALFYSDFGDANLNYYDRDTYHVSLCLTSIQKAITIIANYAKDGSNAPSLSNYSEANVTGVSSSNLSTINSSIESLNYQDVDTTYKIQAIVDNN